MAAQPKAKGGGDNQITGSGKEPSDPLTLANASPSFSSAVVSDNCEPPAPLSDPSSRAGWFKAPGIVPGAYFFAECWARRLSR
jgi:hypothetical protein